MITLVKQNPLKKFLSNCHDNCRDFFLLSLKKQKSAHTEPTDLFEVPYDLKIRSIKERNKEKYNSNTVY